MGKIGIIDVGGGMRGIYPAGVLKYCADRGITFDSCIGVSAGSGNLMCFLSGQSDRNYSYYTDYSLREESVSEKNIATKGCLLDLEYIYGTVSNSDGESPIDYDTFEKNGTEFVIVATDAATGEIKYFEKEDIKKDDYRVLMASSSIPAISKPVRVGESFYYDGALSDSIPVDKIFEMGCEKAVLILTKPKNSLREVGEDEKMAAMIEKVFPVAAQKMRDRYITYNEGLKKALEYEKEGKLLIVSPDDTCGVSTLTKDAALLEKLYQKGIKDAEAIERFLN